MITHLRVTITARNDLYTELVEVAWNLSRTALSNLPAVTKFNIPQTLYGEMTFNNTAKVTGAPQTPLFVAATSSVGSFIAFTDVGNGTLGSLGVSADRKPTFITYSGATHELLHKNNLDSCNVSINFYELAEYHDANLSQTDLNGYGLTSSVISNLKAGKYNKVLDTRDTQVWDYTVDGDKISFKCCDKEVMITKESDGTWYIEFL
jgi:hypothetical protein